MLLVDDQQSQPLEAHVALQQAVRADDDVHLSGFDSLDRACLRLLVDEARQHLDRDREVAQPLREHMEMLLGQDRRGREQRHLFAAHRRLERSSQGQLRLAEADVATQQAIHRAVGLHVRLDLRERRPDRKSTRLNSSHEWISYAVFCLKKKNNNWESMTPRKMIIMLSHC